MKKIIMFFLATFGMAITSCTSDFSQEQLPLEEETAEDGKTKIECSVDEFISDVATRTSVNTAGNYAVTWASGDVIGIFPREGYQEPFEIPADQVGQAKAKFDGGYWALKSGLQYNAYYPFNKANFSLADCKTTIPVTYEDQSQDGTVCNAGAFDYTYSDWAEAVNGSLNFKFHHIGAFFVITLNIPATTTYTSLSLCAGDNIIPVTGTYDLTAAQPAFVPATYDSSITMSLNNYKGVKGEDAVFYMMLPPCDLSKTNLTVKLGTKVASFYYTYALSPQVIESAHLYKVTAHEYVDLGLSVKWATCNVGASKPEQCGDYLAWGETTSKTYYTWSSYFDTEDGGSTFTKYNVNGGKTVLDLDDDAAHQNWGGQWKMPSYDEFEELRTDCSWEWSVLNNVSGYIVTGPSGRSIFLPASGYNNTQNASSGNINNVNSRGYYWSSSLNDTASDRAKYIQFTNTNILWSTTGSRRNGLIIRPVLSEWKISRIRSAGNCKKCPLKKRRFQRALCVC